jgi:hypothetical protein
VGAAFRCVPELGEMYGRRFSILWCPGDRAAQKLLQVHQNSCSVADQAVDFRTLAAESSWNPEALFNIFLDGLLEGLKDELAAQEIPLDLDSLIAHSIRIDGRLGERRCERRSGLGNTRLSDDGTRPKESGNPRSVYF